MDDVYQVKQTKKEEQVRVEYSLPKFWHRCLANLVDFFLFAITALICFIGVRAIVQNTDSYKGVQSQIDEIQLSTGLYRKYTTSEGVTNTLDIVYYIDNFQKNIPYGSEFDTQKDDEPQFINGLIIKSILTFVDYCEHNCSTERYNDLLVYYDEARLNPTLDDIHYFVRDEHNNVVPNTTISGDSTKLKLYYTNIYKPFVENKCIPFLSANVPGYHDLVRMDFKLLVYLEIPVAYTVGAILIYFVPPLFFRRGRKTLGKALYHIGLIDQRLLSPTVPRYLARFAILFFGELVLSLFTFGIPYIVSFSMMAFSKKRQGFPDYMLRLLEVDTSKADIYIDYVEASTKNQLHGKPIDFQMERPL